VFEGQATQAAPLAEENLVLARELDNGPDLTRALYWQAVTKLFQGETEQAVALFEENLAMARERGEKKQIREPLLALGSIALYRGDLVQAETYLQEGLALFRERHNKNRSEPTWVRTYTALALSCLGEIRRRQGDLTQARALCTESLLLAREAGTRYHISYSLIGLAKIAADEGQPEQAARLFGTAEPWLTSSTLDPLERADYERAVEHARAQLGEKAFATAWAQGRTMTPEQAIAAQGQPILVDPTCMNDRTTRPKRPAPSYPNDLTEREVEVLRLVARGLTDAQVAQALVISPRTVNAHLRSIYSKLDITSRTAATHFAIEHHLI
jgi:ATP/maltotriose-dependent transcriptional regulator MalT